MAEELDGWQELVAPLRDPMRQLLAECTSLEEFQRRLPEALAGQDTKPLIEHLARMTFMARLGGETQMPPPGHQSGLCLQSG